MSVLQVRISRKLEKKFIIQTRAFVTFIYFTIRYEYNKTLIILIKIVYTKIEMYKCMLPFATRRCL